MTESDIVVLCTNGRHTSFKQDWQIIRNRVDLPGQFLDGTHLYSVIWHWKIPDNVLIKTRAIGFHSSDLPFGKGGSPIKNCIKLGFSETMVTAFLMTDQIDAGPVLMKRPVSLIGSEDLVMKNIIETCAGMITYLETHGSYPMWIPQDQYFTHKFYRRDV